MIPRSLDVVLYLILVSILAFTALPAAAGCSKDTDCKGDRVCEDGVCVSSSDDDEEADEDWEDPEGGGGDRGGPASMCVTQMGACPMMVPMPKGQGCTCMMPMGPVPGVSR